MRLVVLSDTHGRKERVKEVLGRTRGYDALLFLGDGLRDFDCCESGLVCVRGNCDAFVFGSDAPTERMFYADGVKFLMMHGHEWNVKSSVERAVAHTYNLGADALLFGHTHMPMQMYYPVGSELCGTLTERPIYAFNPGALGAPRAQDASFGSIEVRNGQILFSHGKI